VTTAVATLEKPPTGSNVNEIVDGPGAAEADAWTVNSAGVKSDGSRSAVSGVTVTPGGRPDALTMILEVGTQSPATIEALKTAVAPSPPFRVTAEGATAGLKAGGRAFATNVAVVLMPRGSLTSAVTVTGPGVMPGAALTAKVTTRAGGTSGTGMVAGETVIPAGSVGNVTVGEPV
jgi:hypothetical protein